MDCLEIALANAGLTDAHQKVGLLFRIGGLGEQALIRLDGVIELTGVGFAVAEFAEKVEFFGMLLGLRQDQLNGFIGLAVEQESTRFAEQSAQVVGIGFGGALESSMASLFFF